MMMGLADRVEAWARRFGIPPPPGVDDVGAQAEVATAPARTADGTSSGESEEGNERFSREATQGG